MSICCLTRTSFVLMRLGLPKRMQNRLTQLYLLSDYNIHKTTNTENGYIRFYNYEQCYAHYTKRIMNIQQAKIYGERIVAKPVLLVAIIDGIEANVFQNNRFFINDWLEGHYLMLMSKYAKPSQFDDLTGIEKPF